MLLRRGQALLRSLKPSFAGNGLLERMRSTTFALLGITTAMALGLVAFAVHQDWSVLPAAPIPGVPEPNEVGEARVASEPPLLAAAGPVEGPRDQTVPERGSAVPGPAPSQLSGPRQLTTASPQPPPAPEPTATPPSGVGTSPASPDPGSPASPPAAASEPAPELAPTPTPTTPPAASPSGPPPAVVGGAKKSEKDHGRDDDEAESDDDNAGQDSDDRGKPPGKYKPRGGSKGGKPGKGGDVDSPDLVVPAPAAPPAEEAGDPDDGSEAEDYEYDDDEYDSSSSRGRGHGHGRSSR